ncbi:MAG: DUF1156 domain-containing protein [Fimbriimonadaceae bacterium]
MTAPAPYRKKLIEVTLPLDAINREAHREKSIRHGHPSTLHLWWARRPLAACRAVLFASFVDDPDHDPLYAAYDPVTREGLAGEKRAQLFKLIEELVKWENSNDPLILHAARSEIARCVASRLVEKGELARDHPLPGGATVNDLIVKGHGDLEKLRTGLAQLPPREAVDHFLATYAPPVADPFAGGGSIPLEAQRLGLRAYASDLNPVAVLINKALIEIPPRFAGRTPVHPDARQQLTLDQMAGGQGKRRGKPSADARPTTWEGARGLAEDVRRYGQWMRDEARKRIGHLYPKVQVTAEMAESRPDLRPYVGEELTVIAWLWARTVPSPDPAVGGAHVPLVRSFWLSTKKGKEAWVEPVVAADRKSYRFEVRVGTPPEEQRKVVDAGTKTGRGCKFRCLLSNTPIAEQYVKGAARDGRMHTRLMAIIAEGVRGRVCLSPLGEHAKAAESVDPGNRAASIHAPIANDPRALWCLLYGLDHFDKLFTPRQLVALTTFSDLVMEARKRVLADATASGSFPDDPRPLEDGGTGPAAYADAVATYLAFAIDKSANYWSNLASWHSGRDTITSTFGRQALPMVWDYAEANPLSDSSGNFFSGVAQAGQVLAGLPANPMGLVRQKDAQSQMAEFATIAISTDPPYYDNIGYSDLSDFFYVWARRSVSPLYPSLFRTLLTPKAEELIASPYRHEGSKERAMRFFENGLGNAFKQMAEVVTTNVPMTVFYAFKQSESEEVGEGDTEADRTNREELASTGWETFLEGLLAASFAITGTWPVRTELVGNLKSKVNALASSIVLVCRPRPENARTTSRREFLTALKRELPEALRKLQHGSIAPVDLAQAAIGPGMAVFTRYAAVLEPDGSRMTVRTALGLINQTLDEVLAEQEGEFDAETRWAVAWYQQYGTAEGPFGEADTLSRAKNTAVGALVEAGVVVAKGGKVRLLRPEELPADWDPRKDKRTCHWEVMQQLIRALGSGEEHAARLLAAVSQVSGSLGEVTRDLAYRMYNICERKQWAEEARAYNGLVVAWPEINRLARRRPATRPTEQGLFS